VRVDIERPTATENLWGESFPHKNFFRGQTKNFKKVRRNTQNSLGKFGQNVLRIPENLLAPTPMVPRYTRNLQGQDENHLCDKFMNRLVCSKDAEVFVCAV